MIEYSKVSIQKLSAGSLRLEIRALNYSSIMMCVLFALGLISLLFPFSILLISSIEIGLGYVITLGIFLGSSIFFFRHFIWGLYGKEVYIISATKLIYYNDYKLFKDNFKSLHLKNLKIGYFIDNNSSEVKIFSKVDEVNDFVCYLVLINNGEFVKSSVPIKCSYINDIVSNLMFS